MKKFGYFLLSLSIIIHISVYAYNRYVQAEKHTDRSARLDLNWFLHDLVLQTPYAMEIDTFSDTVDISNANNTLAIFRILPSIMNYKYAIDANRALTYEEKNEKTDAILARLEQVNSIDEAFAYSTELTQLNAQLGLEEEAFNRKQNTRYWTSLAIFIGLYVISGLMIFRGRRSGTVRRENAPEPENAGNNR